MEKNRFRHFDKAERIVLRHALYLAEAALTGEEIPKHPLLTEGHELIIIGGLSDELTRE